MKKSFILLFSFWAFIGTHLLAQCNRPNPSDNPCTAPTFCNNDQLDGFCSTVTTPVTGRKYLKPADFCGSLESPSWFKFVADAAAHSFTFNANNAVGCNGNGVQAAVFEATDCTDSTTFILKSNCINANGGQPVATVNASGLVAGRTYYILVDGYGGQACSYQILNVGAPIRATNQALPTPSVVYGATSVCANATNVTYSVPKNINASDYKFDITINGITNSFVRPDSLYTVTSFPANGTARVCVSYMNDCTVSGTPRCIDITITTNTAITLPTAYLCPGQTYTLPNGNIEDNFLPPNSDQSTPFTINKTGSGGCDTTFNVIVVKYAERTANQNIFLKPSETKAICGKTVSIPAATCSKPDVIVCSGGASTGCDSIINLTIFNAKQTNTITPAAPVLNCNSVTLQVNQSDTCTIIGHRETYQWFFQAQAGDPLSNLNNQQNNLTVTQTGIYTVVVRDSVYRLGQPAFGSRIFLDTVRVTVTGLGGNGAPVQPSLISGKTDTTVCQGARTTLTIPAVPNATIYTWSLTRNGGTIFSGQGTTTVTIDWFQATSGDTVVVVATNACGTSPARRLTVLMLNFPNLNAGVDRATCGLTSTMNATNSTANGSWFSAASNIGGVIFTNANAINSNIQVTQTGLYKLIWRETLNGCTKADTVDYTFNSIPQSSNLKDSCNVARTNYFVKFNITGGTAPYQVVFAGTNTVAGTVGAGGFFTSNALTLGTNAFDIKDANMCSPTPPISVTQGCTNCTTRAGIMDVSTALSICQGDTARATYQGGYVNDGNDTLQFVLHRGDPRSGVFARSNAPRFAYQAGMLFETTYYISAIAGDDSTRQVKLTDPCFSFSPGVPVVFHKRPTATIAVSDSNLCVGTCTNIRFNMTGKSPFNVGIRVTDSTTRDTSFNLITDGSLARICPSRNTTYRLFSVRDSFGCTDTTLTKQVIVRIFQPVFAGIPKTPPLSICSSLDTTITLSTLLTNATAGGTWTEVSSVPSTGGAFTAATGRFRTRNQATGFYRFAYTVKPLAGSPCPNDTAFVSIEVKFTPVADAGADDTIRCNKPQVRIGGSNTSTSTNVTVQWSGGIGGNVPQQDVTQPGTFILTATSNGCSARDTVVVFVDTATPRAIIRPVTQTLTCAVESVQLDGSLSTPIGKINYLWFFNNIPFDNNPMTEARFGGSYALSVINQKNGCVGTDTFTVYENRTAPIVNIVKPLTINCKDTIVTINASSSSRGNKYTFTWKSSNGGRFLRDSTTLTPKVKVSGFYLLTITDTTNRCKDSSFAFVPIDTIRPIAKAIATDSLDCTNPTVALSGRGSTLSAIITYNWNAQTGHIVSGANTLNPVVDEPGFYVLTVQNSRNFCSGIDTAKVIKNNQRPTGVNLAIKKPTCFGECDATFSISSVQGGTSPYIYSLDSKVFTTKKIFLNQCAGTFKLTIQDAGGCLLDTLFSISQPKQLSVSLGIDTTIKLGDSLLLKALTNADTIKSIVWNPLADSTKCPKGSFCREQWVRPTRGTTFTATLTDQNGCRTVGRVNVSIDKRRPIFIPTAFSPNNDSYNDVLVINGSQVVKSITRFQIFDRWGELMFAKANFNTDDPNFGWDGRHKGRDVLPGVYVYYVEVEYFDNTKDIIEGDVTLMR